MLMKLQTGLEWCFLVARVKKKTHKKPNVRKLDITFWCSTEFLFVRGMERERLGASFRTMGKKDGEQPRAIWVTSPRGPVDYVARFNISGGLVLFLPGILGLFPQKCFLCAMLLRLMIMAQFFIFHRGF